MSKRITPTQVAEARNSEKFAEFSNAVDKERSGLSESNASAVDVAIHIAKAADSGDGPLLEAMAQKLGLKRGSAEMTHRGNIGRVAQLPTDFSLDPETKLPKDALRVVDESGKESKRGEKYFRGRLRKYLDLKAKEKGVKPSAVLDELLNSGKNLPEVLAHIESELDPKNQRKPVVIENYFMAEASIKKATTIIETGAAYEGDLDLAKERAELMKVALDKFLAIA